MGEGAWEIATGKLVALSEQQFVDCDKQDSGCSGGLMDTAFKYAEANTLCTESSYAYKGMAGTCKASACTVGIPKGAVKGFKDVSADSEQPLMQTSRSSSFIIRASSLEGAVAVLTTACLPSA